MRRAWGALAAVSLVVSAGWVSPAAAQRVTSVAVHDVPAPRAGRIVVCHGYGCFFRTAVQFSASDMARMRAILAQGAASEAAERTAVARAVAWFETRVGGIAGTSDDEPRSPPSRAGERSQMDCIDHALNTTHFLAIAGDNGWLRHHVVARPTSRGFFLDGRYPHSTAVIRAKESGAEWAVDSWPTRMGDEPEIMPLRDWRIAT